MHKAKVNISRIGLRDRGTASTISIDVDLLIEPDDPDDEMIRHHVPEVVRVDELPKKMRDAIQILFTLCQERASKQQGI